MKTVIKLLIGCAMLVPAPVFASGSYSLDDWTLGMYQPEIASGTRGDGTTGKYIHVPVGTSSFYLEMMNTGEGAVTMWIYDPGNCLESTDPGYGSNGPKWGMQSPLYQSFSVGIQRASYVAGCQGYSPWSTVSPYTAGWFCDGVRGSQGNTYTPGWYKWTVNGTWDAISFTLYNVWAEAADGAPHDDLVFGNVTRTYDATSMGGAWEAIFGEGWKAVYFKGDGANGIEDINVQLTAGTGVFSEISAGTPQLADLSGTVQALRADSSVLAMDSATVKVSWLGGTRSKTTTTNASGVYAFSGLDRSYTYTMKVTATGLDTTVTTLILDQSTVIKNIWMTIQPDAAAFSSFSGEKIVGDPSDSLRLTWNLLLEQNITGWDLWRSNHHDTGYEKISAASTSGAGPGTSYGTSYAYTDTIGKNGDYYYYLAWQGLDLTISYSDTIEFHFTGMPAVHLAEGTSLPGLSNPLRPGTDIPARGTLTLFDLQGNRTASFRGTVGKTVQPGLYIYIAESRGKRYHGRVMVTP